MNRWLLMLLGLMISCSSFGQCDFSISSLNICGSECISVKVINPDSSILDKYSFSFGDPANMGKVYGTELSYCYPGATTVKTYKVKLYNGNTGCTEKIVTVNPAPDASLDDMDIFEPWKNCNGNITQPQFTITVRNISATKVQNTNYKIDWGDGTANYTASSFETVAHTYTTLGIFKLKFTVTGNSFGPCNTVTREYDIFNGSNPDVGIISLGTTVALCAPAKLDFHITGTDQNLAGTTYDVYITNDKIYSFNHPAPSGFSYTFEETSCGHTAGGYPNAFSVRIVAKNVCSTKEAAVAPITIGTPPLPAFTMNPSGLCSSDPTTFTNVSVGSNYVTNGVCNHLCSPTWTITPDTGWTLISGDMSSSESIKVDFHNKGPYKVKLVVENKCGIDSIEKTITLKDGAKAMASATPDNNSCTPIIYNFKNNSTGDSLTYKWAVTPNMNYFFVSGTSDTSKNISLKFLQGGDYQVALTCTNSCGSDTWDTLISIKGAPIITLKKNIYQCDNSPFYPVSDIKNGNSAITNIAWSFVGGIPAAFSGLLPPPITYPGNGVYIITVIATNNCGTTIETQTLTIMDKPNLTLSPDTIICQNSSSFKLHTTLPGGRWEGQGVTDSVLGIFDPQFCLPGTNVIRYIVDLGQCTVSDSFKITINSPPSVNAGPDITVCGGDRQINLGNNSPNGGQWFGNGIVNPSTGAFNPSLISGDTAQIGYYFVASNGCSDSAFRKIKIDPAPFIDIPDPIGLICSGDILDLSITDTSTLTVTWNMGNGVILNGKDIHYLYPDTGTYNISVSATNLYGCNTTVNTIVEVGSVPSIAIQASQLSGCNGFTVQFEASKDISSVSYLWNFGNGHTDTKAKPDLVYFAPGQFGDTTYLVSLTTTTSCGQKTQTESVLVKRSPLANFAILPPTGCTPFTASFLNTTAGTQGQYSWNFGNGKSSDQKDPAPQTYYAGTNDSIYQVTLIATNTCGADTISQTITVHPKDVRAACNLDVSHGCAPLQVTFTNYSSIGAAVIYYFGDGTSSTQPNINHTYINAGNYKVMQVAKSPCSSDTTYRDIIVEPGPAVKIITEPISCSGKQTVLKAQYTDCIGFSWDFGDGKTGDGPNVKHIYTNSGNYDITLIGENIDGCTDTTHFNLEILQTPEADFNVLSNPGCMSTPILLDNTSTGANIFHWRFSDGTESFNQVPQKAFNAPGYYDIQLVVSKADVCFDSINKLNAIEILPRANADFDIEIDHGLKNGSVKFINKSERYTSVIWYFGDGNSSSTNNPDYYYAEPGPRSITLHAINSDGCDDSITKIINIDFTGQIFVPNAFIPELGGTEASIFKPKGYGLREYHLQIFSSYGDIIWESDKLTNGQPTEAWDGSFKGKILPQDIYIWKIRAVFENGTTWEGNVNEKGNKSTMGLITLLR